MTQAELKKIIAKGEGMNTEFKRSFGRECVETVCAFANNSRVLDGMNKIVRIGRNKSHPVYPVILSKRCRSGFVRMRGYLKDSPGTSMTYREAGNGFEVIHLPDVVGAGPESGAQSGAQSMDVLQLLREHPFSANEVAEKLGLKSKTGALKRTIKDLFEGTVIEYTLPAKPNSRLQKYRITEKGKQMLKAAN